MKIGDFVICNIRSINDIRYGEWCKILDMRTEPVRCKDTQILIKNNKSNKVWVNASNFKEEEYV